VPRAEGSGSGLILSMYPERDAVSQRSTGRIGEGVAEISRPVARFAERVETAGRAHVMRQGDGSGVTAKDDRPFRELDKRAVMAVIPLRGNRAKPREHDRGMGWADAHGPPGSGSI